MFNIIKSSWTLLLGMFLLMISNGLLVTLLSFRGALEGMSTTQIGLLQSAYPLGALFGSLLAPRLVIKVGHIRVFAAAASMASVAALIHMQFVNVPIWASMRLLSGLCFAGLYIVVESWLNAQVENRYRAQLFSIYFIVTMAGAALGQYLIGQGEIGGTGLFVLVSVLISVSLVPVLIADVRSSAVELPESMSLAQIFPYSPTAILGTFLMGIVFTVFYVNFVLYFNQAGMKQAQVGMLVACGTLGTLLFQYPIARLSDRMDRRNIICACCLLGVPVLVLIPLASTMHPALLYASVFLFGGLTFPVYSLCVALLNDRLESSQMVAASGTIVLVLNLGQMVGPSVTSVLMDHFGSGYVFGVLIATLLVLAGISLLRRRRKPLDIGEQEPAMGVTAYAPTIVGQFPESSGNRREPGESAD